MRIIPRNTKVATEFFTGVSLSDILVGTVGVLLIFFVIISNLPYKIGICGAIALIFILLLVRIDTEANYMFLHRIAKHFSYYRSYRKFHENPFEEMEAEKIETEEAANKKTEDVVIICDLAEEIGSKKDYEKNSKNKKEKKTLVEFFLKEDKKKNEGAAQT